MNATRPESTTQDSRPMGTPSAKLMNAADYRESLRRYKPTVYVDGQLIDSVADAPSLRPGVQALGVSYDFALRPELAALMTARQSRTGQVVGIKIRCRCHGKYATCFRINGHSTANFVAQ